MTISSAYPFYAPVINIIVYFGACLGTLVRSNLQEREASAKIGTNPTGPQIRAPTPGETVVQSGTTVPLPARFIIYRVDKF